MKNVLWALNVLCLGPGAGMHTILSILSHPTDFSQISHMLSQSTALSTVCHQNSYFKKNRWFILRFTGAPAIEPMACACALTIWKMFIKKNVDLVQANNFLPRISWIWIKWMGVLKLRLKNKSELRKLIILFLGLSNRLDLFLKVVNIFQILNVWYSYTGWHADLQPD